MTPQELRRPTLPAVPGGEEAAVNKGWGIVRRMAYTGEPFHVLDVPAGFDWLHGDTARPALCGARPVLGSWGTVSGYAGWERLCKRCLRAARRVEEDEAVRAAVRSLPASFYASAWEEEG
jgi:hypothetical protein